LLEYSVSRKNQEKMPSFGTKCQILFELFLCASHLLNTGDTSVSSKHKTPVLEGGARAYVQ
jgi:hypothetical protein